MTYIAKPPFAATEVRSFHALRRWIEERRSRPGDDMPVGEHDDARRSDGVMPTTA